MTELDTQAAYALWAPHYPPTPHNALMHAEQAAVLSLIPSVQGALVLDAGCGTGRYTALLRSHGARVCSIDRSQPMISQAQSSSRLLGDLRALPIATATFDAVVCGLALNDVISLDPVITELARVLRSGGVLVASLIHSRGAEARWTRTFEVAGGTWSLPAHWHSLRDYERACRTAGLVLQQHLEPEIPGQRGPVALVVRAAKR
jgi:SAM-dependent methyltransferase